VHARPRQACALYECVTVWHVCIIYMLCRDVLNVRSSSQLAKTNKVVTWHQTPGSSNVIHCKREAWGIHGCYIHWMLDTGWRSQAAVLDTQWYVLEEACFIKVWNVRYLPCIATSDRPLDTVPIHFFTPHCGRTFFLRASTWRPLTSWLRPSLAPFDLVTWGHEPVHDNAAPVLRSGGSNGRGSTERG
jgi:hypothetical protein